MALFGSPQGAFGEGSNSKTPSGSQATKGKSQPEKQGAAFPSSLVGSQKLKAQEEAIREQMLSISRQLGVRCTACHNLKNFASDEMAAFKVSKEHLRITQLLIDAGMDGKQGRPKADCYMCHRGELKPPPYNPAATKGLTNEELLRQ